MTSKITALLPKMNVLGHPFVRQIVPYMGLWGILLVLLVWVDTYLASFTAPIHLGSLLGIVLVLGSLNWFILERAYLVKGTTKLKTGLTCLVTLLAVFVFWFKNQPLTNAYTQLYLPTLVFFVLPSLIALTFKAHLSIPALSFTPIEVNSLQEFVGNPFSEDNSLGVSWVLGNDFNKFSEDGTYAFRTYTPRNVKNLKLGELFKALLAFHNYNISPQQAIDFKNCGWVFYKESVLFFPKGSKALDPEKTVFQNGITFQKLSKDQRANSESSGIFLPKDFRFATIYIYRTYPQAEESNQLSS